MGINNFLAVSTPHSTIGGTLNQNLDFTSDEHIENTGILNSNCINISNTLHHSNIKNNQINTLEEENLVMKIQQSLEVLKSNTENENIAWLNRLQSKYFLLFIIIYFVFFCCVISLYLLIEPLSGTLESIVICTYVLFFLVTSHCPYVKSFNPFFIEIS